MPQQTTPKLGHDGRILEGIVTTLHADGSVNISPMGPIVDEEVATLVLRPFQSSTTYQNLKRTGQGVFHVTDDVWLFAQAAVGPCAPLPSLRPAVSVAGMILSDACRHYEFEVESLDDRDQRTCIVARTTASGRQRDFFGFNRAKHAVLEAAILATRVHLLPAEEILSELARLHAPVEKTGGSAERAALEFLQDYIASHVNVVDETRTREHAS